MSLKSTIKHAVFGPPGNRAADVKHGLLKGLRFNVDPASKTMRLVGMDEREIERDVRALASRVVSALDIGANDGWYTVFFASLPNIKNVYAFEPSTELVPSLQDNLALNDPGMLKKVTSVNKMVGNRNDEQWCSIDQFLPDIQLPAIFKIDVDGGEMDVFRGAAKTLARDGCLIVLETHTAELEKECQTFLDDLGYQTRIIKNGWYRAFINEARTIEHNRWLVATRDQA